MKTTFFYLCLLVLFLPVDAFTQESIYGITFERIVTTGSISCMLQDQTGFIWLGDESGLYKYDGYKLTAYQHEPSDPGSLPDNWVTAICEQDSLIMWIGTYRGGMSRFDKKKQPIYPVLARSGQSEQPAEQPDFFNLFNSGPNRLGWNTNGNLLSESCFRGEFFV